MNISFRLFGRLITIDISRWNDEGDPRRQWHKNGIWVTKEGRKIPVDKMDDMHLINVLSMLEKKAERLSRSVWSYPEPSKEEVLSRFPIYSFIIEELRARGL